MPFKQHAIPLQLAIKSSKLLMAIHVVLHSVAIAAVFVSGLNTFPTIALCLVVAVNGVLAYRWCTRNSALHWSADGQWHLRINHSEEQAASLLASSVVTRYCVWLHFYTSANRFVTLLILPDSVPPDSFRRLRVRLQIDHADNDKR